MPPAYLRRPGLAGAFGALLDEWARAAEDFCRCVESHDQARFTATREDPDPDSRSVKDVAGHVVWAAWGHANHVRAARGLAIGPKPDLARLVSPADVRPLLVEAGAYFEDTLEGLHGASDAEIIALEFTARWGQKYDPETMMEHTVVHLLRHRRQVERWRA
jgi:hypothetical protein